MKIYHQDNRGLRNVDLPMTLSDNPNPPTLEDQMNTLRITGQGGAGAGQAGTGSGAMEVRLDEKVLHCAWHPTSNTIAVAGKTGLCLYKV